MKQFMTTLFAIGIISFSFAQGNAYGKNKANKPPKETAEESAKKRTDKLAAKINLTPEQQSKVYQLKLNRIQAMRTAKSSKPVNGQMIKDANKAYKEGMRQVLTPEQIQLLKEQKKEHGDKNKGGHKGSYKNNPKGNKKQTPSNDSTKTPMPSPSPSGNSGPSGTRDLVGDEDPDFDL